jgi:hypothetical protein
MTGQRLPSLSDLPHRIREGLATWPDRLRDWWHEVGREPVILGPTPGGGVLLWILGGGVFFRGAGWLTAALTPGAAGLRDGQATPYAILYVACTAEECRAHFTSRQAMDFDAWPLKCPRCGADTVYRATVCDRCRQWYATAPGQPRGCPLCAKRGSEAPVDPQQTERADDHPDDLEDPWP